jgi:hypothetical protein
MQEENQYHDHDGISSELIQAYNIQGGSVVHMVDTVPPRNDKYPRETVVIKVVPATNPPGPTTFQLWYKAYDKSNGSQSALEGWVQITL